MRNNFREFENKWQTRWDEEKAFHAATGAIDGETLRYGISMIYAVTE